MINLIKNFLDSFAVKSPNDFIKKFLRDSLKKNVIFELYYNENIIIQLENLSNIDTDIYKKMVSDSDINRGYVLSFALQSNTLESSDVYKKYKLKNNKLKLSQIDYPELNLVGFFKIIDENKTVYEIGDEIKNVILSVYDFKEENPQLVYNLRYIKNE